MQAPPKKDYALWISGCALILFSAAFLWGAFSLYQDRMATVSLTERSFLTTEWRLLQEMKEKTDRQLFQKDQEIADLNRLYLQLIHSDASPARRLQVKNQLDQAEAERKTILARSISAVVDTVAPQAATSGAPQATTPGAPQAATPGAPQAATPFGRVSSGSESALAAFMQNRIDGLQAQLESRRALIGALDKERMDLIASHQQVVERYSDTIREDMARIQELSATAARRDKELRAALAAVRQKAGQAGTAQPMGIQDLKTQALVRAIVGSPEIRAAYPELLKSLDHFFELYGLQERLNGQREAYEYLESVLGPLAGESEPQ